jgi:hypothetical protein
VRLSPLGTSATNWPIPAPDDRWWWMWSSRWNENWQGKQKYSDKTYPSATLSSTNPTWPDLATNPGRRGGKPATNRLSYGTALFLHLNRTRVWLMHQVASAVCAGVSFHEPHTVLRDSCLHVCYLTATTSRLQSAVLRNAVSADVTAHLCSGCRTVWTGSTRRHPHRLHLSSAYQITARCSSWYPMPFGARCGSRSLSDCCCSSYFITLHPGMHKFLQLTASAKHQTLSRNIFCVLNPDLVPLFPTAQ